MRMTMSDEYCMTMSSSYVLRLKFYLTQKPCANSLLTRPAKTGSDWKRL